MTSRDHLIYLLVLTVLGTVQTVFLEWRRERATKRSHAIMADCVATRLQSPPEGKPEGGP